MATYFAHEFQEVEEHTAFFQITGQGSLTVCRCLQPVDDVQTENLHLDRHGDREPFSHDVYNRVTLNW